VNAVFADTFHFLAALLTDTFHSLPARASRLPVSERQRNLRRMLDWRQCSAVERVPGKVSGAWVFKGTRVPVQALFENLEGGATVDQFLEWFPGVAREQALTVLKFAESSLTVATA
jgi:uncharacterized protein (DUF433 family)